MIIPVRCFSCGKVVGDKWEEFKKRVEFGEYPSEVLNDLGFSRICCRRMLLSNVSIIDNLLRYHGNKESYDLRERR
jgi:DNA-directed RNA polymerase subunit N